MKKNYRLLPGVTYLHALFLFALLVSCTLRTAAQYNSFTIPAIANGNSSNGRGPITTSLFHRSNAVYKASELTPYLSSGDTIGKVGWSILTAGGSVTGTIKIYLVNTTDVTNSRSTTWATLLTTPTAMTLVYNGSMTIPASATVYSVTLTTPFIYTGAGIYVAYEWTPSTTSTAAVYNCNTDITGAQWNAQGTSLPATLNLNSNFRAQVVLGIVPKKIDASVDELYSLGKLPIPYANPHVVRTRITNKGKDTLFSWPVTLNITGANTFTTTSYIDTLLPGGNSKYVDFAGFSPANTGNNILTVSVPIDSVSSNNSKTFNQTINLNSYNYADPTLPSLGGVGFTGATGDFVAKFKYTGTNKINQVGVNFFAGGQSVKIGIWDTSATGTPGTLLWQSASFTSVTGINTIPVNPKLSISGSFYVGVIQFNTANANFGFQNENPIRDKTFYYTSPTGSSTWSDFSVTNSPFRFMIEPRLELANDVSVTQLLAPLTGCLDTVSNQQISLRVMNVGLLAQNFVSNNLSVRVSVTNPLNVTTTLPATVISTGTLASGDSITVNPVTNYNMTTPGTYTFKLWAGTSTEVNTNDTLTVTMNVKPLPPVVTPTVTYCQNATAIALTATGANTLLWFNTSSGGAGSTTAPTPVTTSAGTTLYYVADSNATTGCISARSLITVSVTAPVANNSITSSPQIICSGSTPAGITASTATGGDGTTYTYQWLSSTTSATAGFSAIAGSNTQNYSPAALTQATWFRRRVTSGVCAADTTTAIKVDINLNSTWNGSISNVWADPDNWSNGVVPCSNGNVTVPALSFNFPVITTAITLNNLTINSGATLTLTGASAQLNIVGVFTNNGTFNAGTGKTVFNGAVQQTIPAGNYTKLQINNTAGAIIGGAVTLSDSLILTNGLLYLDVNNLTLGTSSYASAGSATSFIKTNGTGSVIVNGVGNTGKTGTVIIPVGNTTFNPVKLLNAGTTDNFTVRLFDSVTTNYSGSSSTGAKLTNNALNRTWIINEGTAGGSNATVTLQWNTADELSGFNRALCYVARYNGTVWTSTTATAATGLNPYTQTRSGITSFSPFSVGSGGTLPVELVSFKGEASNNKVLLTWATASEINNDHFVVERSVDNVNFTAIGSVKGVGNSSRLSTYNFTDAEAVALAQPTLYYRLKQVDFDGTVTYSSTVSVNILNKGNHAVEIIAPNPFENTLKITFKSTQTVTNVQVKITDINGRIVSERTVSSPVGMQFINLDNLANLTTGMYNVVVITNGETNTYKVVKN